MRTSLSTGCLVAFSICLSASASPLASPRTILNEAKSLRCEMNSGTFNTWREGRLFTKPDRYSEPIVFDSIDFRSGSARLVTKDGATEVTARRGGPGLTFVEETLVGNLSITTVFAHRIESGTKFAATNSRHIMGLDAPMVSQFYGACEVNR